jgi:broad specificity phosphatase PhoE
VISGPRGCRGLTELGRRQAVALLDHLADTGRIHADVLLTSSLPRAIETANIIAPALGVEEIRTRCSLCEVHTGDADGLLWTEYTTRYGSFDMETEPERVFAPGGESWMTFHQRVQEMCVQLCAEFAGRSVVAVCHAGVITASIRMLFGIPHPGTGTRLQPTNTGMTEWGYQEEARRWTLRSFNEQSHLFDIHDSESEAEKPASGEVCQ